MSKAKNGFRKSGIHPFNRLIFTDEDFVAAAVTNQEQNNPNSDPIGKHTTCLLNNPRQEQVKTKCISASISDSQETSTNHHTNVFSLYQINPVSQKLKHLCNCLMSLNLLKKHQENENLFNLLL